MTNLYKLDLEPFISKSDMISDFWHLLSNLNSWEFMIHEMIIYIALCFYVCGRRCLEISYSKQQKGGMLHYTGPSWSNCVTSFLKSCYIIWCSTEWVVWSYLWRPVRQNLQNGHFVPQRIDLHTWDESKKDIKNNFD